VAKRKEYALEKYFTPESDEMLKTHMRLTVRAIDSRKLAEELRTQWRNMEEAEDDVKFGGSVALMALLCLEVCRRDDDEVYEEFKKASSSRKALESGFAEGVAS